ncbi:MAG: ABC transporter substrate-binding protein [Thermomicrobiales bacterium]
MTRKIDIEEMLRKASPATRREFLRRAAVTGMSAPAALALLAGINPSGALAEGDDCPGNGASTDQFAAMPVKLQGEPKQGGTMVVMGHHEVASLHPDDAGPSVHWVVVTQIHNALYEIDENYQFNPVLAESYETSEDGITWTFKLREGVQFHDGEEFSSEDVKYTYDWYLNPENAAINANEFASVASVEAPDEYTVVVTLKEPNPAFINKVAVQMIMPAHYHAEVGNDAYKAEPVGTGPFKLKEWRPAESTTLEAFDDHFRGRPHLDEFREDIVPEASVRMIAMETGDADSAVWPLVTEDSLVLADNPDFTVFQTSGTAVNHFPLNNTAPQLSDKRVRQAMLYAIDRQKVIDDIFQGAATIATANLSPAFADWYNPDVTLYPYDVEEAKALLDEAGWTASGDEIREKDGETLSFTCTVITGDQARRPEAEVVQQYLRAVGIDMQIEEAPTATILEQLREGNMQASLFNWTYGGDSADPDALVTLKSDGANNFSHYSNPRVDELLDQGLTELDVEKRKAIYNEVQQIVADEVPFLYMMFWDIFTPFNGRIKGLPESAQTSDPIYAKAYQFWIEE